MPPLRTSPPPRTAAVLLLLLPLAACGSEDPVPSGPRPVVAQPSLPSVAEGVGQAGQPRLINLIVVDGRVSGVTDVVEVMQNVPVRFTVTADVADVLEVQGYGASAQLTVMEPVQLSLITDRTGDFPVVLQGSDQVLTTLRVR